MCIERETLTPHCSSKCYTRFTHSHVHDKNMYEATQDHRENKQLFHNSSTPQQGTFVHTSRGKKRKSSSSTPPSPFSLLSKKQKIIKCNKIYKQERSAQEEAQRSKNKMGSGDCMQSVAQPSAKMGTVQLPPSCISEEGPSRLSLQFPCCARSIPLLGSLHRTRASFYLLAANFAQYQTLQFPRTQRAPPPRRPSALASWARRCFALACACWFFHLSHVHILGP